MDNTAQGKQIPPVVVCGLARCGTSLMMKMLHKGGIDPLCDPSSFGYGYEYDPTLSLPDNHEWLNEAWGKAVKVLDPHHLRVPRDRPYAFILLERDPREQAKSHAKFLNALGVATTRNTKKQIERSLRRDLPQVKALLSSYPDSQMLTLQFERIIDDPLGSAERLDDFLQRDDFNMLDAARVVMRRTPRCLPYLMEAMV